MVRSFSALLFVFSFTTSMLGNLAGLSAAQLEEKKEAIPNTAVFEAFREGLEQKFQRGFSESEAWQVLFDEGTPEQIADVLENDWLDPFSNLRHEVARKQLEDPRVIIRIEKKSQRMTVEYEGQFLPSPVTKTYDWKISTARKGKSTPNGYFIRDSFSPNHRSRLYGGAPMPWSIFFNGNIAVHGTVHIEDLGKRASAGCVRLHPTDAEYLFRIVYNYPGDQEYVQFIVQDSFDEIGGLLASR